MPDSPPPDSRKQRLAEELRANLRRRKAQARGSAAERPDSAPADDRDDPAA